MLLNEMNDYDQNQVSINPLRNNLVVVVHPLGVFLQKGK